MLRCPTKQRANAFQRSTGSLRASVRRPVAVYASSDRRVVVEGDLVTLHFVMKDMEDGTVIEDSRATGEPLEFEVGAGEAMGNPLFRAYDEAVRGLAVGDRTELEASGGEWNPDLLFKVPKSHPEVQRLEGRYKNLGGLVRGAIVELSNGGQALVIEVDDEAVVLDANNMLAGKKLLFELEVLDISSIEEEVEEINRAREQIE